MRPSVLLLLLTPFASGESFFVSRANDPTGICVARNNFAIIPILDPKSFNKTKMNKLSSSWTNNWIKSNFSETPTSWFAPYEWQYFPQVTSNGEYENLTTLDKSDAFFVSVLSEGAADFLLAISASSTVHLRVQRDHNNSGLTLSQCSNDHCTLLNEDELGESQIGQKSIQWWHLGFELHQETLTVTRIKNSALNQRWSGKVPSNISLKSVSVKASRGLFKLHQGAKVTAGSASASLRRKFNFDSAQRLEVRVRSHVRVGAKRPTVSVDGAESRALEAAAGGGGRLAVQTPVGQSEIELADWTQGTHAKVFVYIKDHLYISTEVAIGCQFFSHSANDDAEETFADASDRCSSTVVGLSIAEKERICKALDTTGDINCENLRYCSAATIDGDGEVKKGIPVNEKLTETHYFIVESVSVAMTVLCALSLVLAALATVQVQGMKQRPPMRSSADESARKSSGEENNFYEEIRMTGINRN